MKNVQKFEGILDDILEGMTSANVMPHKFTTPPSQQDDDDDLEFPVEVLSTVTDDHYHIMFIHEDGSGEVNMTINTKNVIGDSHEHDVTDYMTIEPASDGHTHKIAL